MKKPVLLGIIASVSMGLFLFFLTVNQNSSGSPVERDEIMGSNDSEQPMLPGEQFIHSWMWNEDGTLRTHLQDYENSDPNVALGAESLSESLGLWLLYVVEKKDQPLFDRGVDVLQAHFLGQDGWIYWKVGHPTQKVTTNALVDDLRIAEALYKASALWSEPGYLELAKQIGQSIMKRNVVEGMFVDFHDIRSNWSNRSITLSYLNSFAFEEMFHHQQVSEEAYHKSIQFLQALPLKQGFFPFSYDVEENVYHYHQEVNMIDQLYIYYHLVRTGAEADEFWRFVQDTFYSKGGCMACMMYKRKNQVSSTNLQRYTD
ncbi:glycosyl hydrolase family 8 [Caldalkalibacillus mannanilyticus]|uniref:glycosyl hydrolase family 8 n=1 Tax=Caldalkalibacillus mannanilyticus TaxID=1418 RepID=UPI0006854661|nr:hypothetical protein [Caldalkalibacillus mannanilyticus]